MPQRLYNTLSGRVEPLLPADPARITFYSCGPTVYDDAHIGNFRSFLAADLLRRWLESPLCELEGESAAERTRRAREGRRVEQVMNITDVGHMTDDSSSDGGGEDKMQAAARRVAQAKKAGTLPQGARIDPGDPASIAAFYADRFREDARRLGLRVVLDADRDASLMPRATASVPGMIEMIGALIERGHAYVVGPAGRQTVYFSVQSFPEYGRLSGNTLDKLREGAGERIDATHQAQKRHPADFLLWKADPAHIMKWPSPWGDGYPGWHIECSVMSLGRLDPGAARGEIDLHSGGEDNIFPHHECEIAQTRAFTGRDRFARHWFHPRFLLVEGEKMSKSKGNFYTARDLFAAGHEPAAVRLELIRTHYRSNANFTEQGLRDSARTVERWRRFAEAAGAGPAGDADAEVARAFAAALHDDLNIAGAIAAVNEWIGRTARPTRGDAALMGRIDAVLGLLALERAAERDTELGVFIGVEPAPEVESLLRQRADARQARDFARADEIRDRLAAMGLAIKDAPGGRVEVRRRG